MSLQRNKAQTHKASSSGHETTLPAPGQDMAPQSRSHGTCTFLRDTDPSLGNVLQEPRAKRSPSGHVVPLFTPKRMQLNHSQEVLDIVFFFFLKINFFS